LRWIWFSALPGNKFGKKSPAPIKRAGLVS
jgi:hypothetical protein